MMESEAAAASKIAVIAVQAAAEIAATRHTQVLSEIGNVRDEVKAVKTGVLEQSGRIGKLEIWKVQQGTVMAIAIAAGPFVFWALNRWAG